jgi:pimeloyl-ACP methyl ester carboxylesterase
MTTKQSTTHEQPVKTVKTDTLEIGYLEHGPSDGWPVIVSHGFPYDANAFNEVASILVKSGARVIAPFTRGFGSTYFLSKDTMRNGQQAARGLDIIQLSEALKLDRPILGGFDWGGNASCVAALLWPEKVSGLVSYASYDVIDIKEQKHGMNPSLERVCWYQHLFQSERGRECLLSNRYEMGRILWNEWSPGWKFDEKTYKRTASAFENPDFVEVVIHCYRFMHGSEKGDPGLQSLEDLLARKPKMTIPSVTIDGSKDPLKPGGTADHAKLFSARHEHMIIDTGHNVAQESPQSFAEAVLKIRGWVS